MTTYFRELIRPWKLATLYLGIGVLMVGSKWPETAAPDWDTGISVLMAAVAYLTAPQAVRLIGSLEWRKVLLGAAMVWFGADGCYAIHWAIKDPAVLDQMRAGNVLASVCLYLLCGLMWKRQTSLLDGLRSISAALGFRPKPGAMQ